MSLLERDSVLVSTTENGDPIVDLPFTRVNNIEGIGRSANTTYSVGDVVYTDSNNKVALKCTTAGTTSVNELDVSDKAIGVTVTDGSVVWVVIKRGSEFIHFTNFSELGLASSATLLEVLNAMPKNSQFVQYIGANTYQTFGVPDAGIVVCAKGQGSNYANLWHQRYGGSTNIARKVWFENWAQGQTSVNWKEVAWLEDGVLPISKGGTGATTAAKVRAKLGLDVTSIPANSDLDNYKTEGKYSCWEIANAQTLTNNPMAHLNTGIILEVIEDNDNVLQVLYGTEKRGMYVREYRGSWGAWKNINNGIKSGNLANSGYVEFEDSLVLAWKRAVISTQGTVVTKPISFLTFVAVAGQLQTKGASDLVASWAADQTTNTTDTFTGSKSEDNMVIFWVGYKV